MNGKEFWSRIIVAFIAAAFSTGGILGYQAMNASAKPALIANGPQMAINLTLADYCRAMQPPAPVVKAVAPKRKVEGGGLLLKK